MPYVGSVPQSGCRFTDPTQLLMIAAELGSTGAPEISVFQRLLPVKGTKPFNEAVCPTDMPLQERFPPPVPGPFPPGPPVFAAEWETPEQALRPSASKEIADQRKKGLNGADLRPGIQPFSALNQSAKRGQRDMSRFRTLTAAVYFARMIVFAASMLSYLS